MDDMRPRLVTNDRTMRDDLIASVLDQLSVRVEGLIVRVNQLTEGVALLLDADRELVQQLEKLARGLANIVDVEGLDDDQ